MKWLLSVGLLAVLGASQSIPAPYYAPTPTHQNIQLTKQEPKEKSMMSKAYGYASDQAGKLNKSVGKIFKKKQKTQLTASQYPFYTVQSASVVNPGQSQFKSPMLKVIQ